MNKTAETPLDELRAFNADAFDEHRDLNNGLGCFFRFMERFNPNELGHFIRAEADRGVPYPELMDALSQGIAYHLIAISIMSTDVRGTYRALVVGAQRYALEMMSTGGGIEVVRVQGSTQTEVTLEGIFKSDGGGA